MKAFLFILITLFFFSFSSAQIIDTIRVIKLSDTLRIKKNPDSVSIPQRIDTIKKPQHPIDVLMAKNPVDILQLAAKLDSIRIDSLIRPFYSITFDSATNKNRYTPRFRMTIDRFTQDTTYIPVPKPKNYKTIKSNLVIDTLEIINPIKQVAIDTTKFAKDPVWWANKNSIGFDISEAAFVNWNAGGNNSISGLLKVAFVRSYKKLHLLWHNEIFARYGVNRQQDRELRKTDDKLQINSTFGYRRDTISNWYYSVKFNFNTQFTEGYRYPDTSTPISRFFSPAYLFLGAGTQYELKKEKLSVYLSPITLKSTFVLDDDLSNDGAFGVVKGEKSRNEFGFLVESSWITNIVKNVTMSNRLTLYSDYLRDFGNVDIKWGLGIDMTVNKHIKANISTDIIYDNDIKFKEDIDNDGTLETFGARIQIKQLLGIGIRYDF